MDTLELLEERINENLEYLEQLEEGSEEYETVTKITNGLLDRYTKMKEIESDAEIKQELHNEEMDEKKKSGKRDLILRCVEIGLTAVIGVAGLCWKEHTSNKLLKYEEEGSLISTESKSWYSSLFRNK